MSKVLPQDRRRGLRRYVVGECVHAGLGAGQVLQLSGRATWTWPTRPRTSGIDILPRLKAGDSSYSRPVKEASSGGSRFTGRVTPSPPRAVTACPAAMFRAAFTSAWQAKPQAVHTKRA